MRRSLVIKDICSIKSGKRLPKGHDFSEEKTPYKYIRARDIKSGKIDDNDLAYIQKETREKIGKYIVNTGDVAITIAGTIGEIGYVTEAFDGINLTENAIRLTDFEPDVDSHYVAYWLLLPSSNDHMTGVAAGSAQPKMGIYKVEQIPISLPDLSSQKRIVAILSAYDSLIENNQRQIKLLEEAAQRLYKEWFVDLRYPGHENVPVVDGVPEGWIKTPFSERVDVLSGGTPKTSNSEYYNGSIPFYSPKDSIERFFVFDTETHISEIGLENCNSKLYPEGTIIITARGTVGKTSILAVPMAMNQSCYALRSTRISSVPFLFFALRQEMLALKTMANGGVFDTIIVKTFDRINLTTPPEQLIKAFDIQVNPMMERMKNLLKQNTYLTEARDRLLPKLMSGEIAV